MKYFEKGTKYYIHISLYIIIIIILSISLTGNWVETNLNSDYNETSIKFNLFNFKSNNNIYISKIFDKFFKMTIEKIDTNNNSNNINITTKSIFPDINLLIEEELNNFNIKNIRNNLTDNALNYAMSNINTNAFNITFSYKNDEITQQELNDYLRVKVFEEINNAFNKERSNDINFFSIDYQKENNNKMTDEERVIFVQERANYVKSGDLKDDIKNVQNLIRRYFIIIQVVVIISIVLLFIHTLLIAFRGRRKHFFSFSGIITVFLPLLILLVFAIIYFILVSLKANFLTDYFLLYTIGTVLLFVTWLLGFFKII